MTVCAPLSVSVFRKGKRWRRDLSISLSLSLSPPRALPVCVNTTTNLCLSASLFKASQHYRGSGTNLSNCHLKAPIRKLLATRSHVCVMSTSDSADGECAHGNRNQHHSNVMMSTMAFANSSVLHKGSGIARRVPPSSVPTNPGCSG